MEYFCFPKVDLTNLATTNDQDRRIETMMRLVDVVDIYDPEMECVCLRVCEQILWLK